MVLGSSGASDQRPMASTTKIMTGLLVLENADLDDVVTISQEAADTGGQEIGLIAGEQMTVGSLFRALMVRSANDAAAALAEHISGSVDGFVQLMNDRADEMGLENTSFANPHGLDAPGHYSSAGDLLTMAREAMTHPEFADVVRSRVMVMTPAPDGTQRVGISTNLMLSSYDGHARGQDRAHPTGFVHIRRSRRARRSHGCMRWSSVRRRTSGTSPTRHSSSTTGFAISGSTAMQ